MAKFKTKKEQISAVANAQAKLKEAEKALAEAEASEVEE